MSESLDEALKTRERIVVLTEPHLLDAARSFFAVLIVAGRARHADLIGGFENGVLAFRRRRLVSGQTGSAEFGQSLLPRRPLNRRRFAVRTGTRDLEQPRRFGQRQRAVRNGFPPAVG